LQPLEDGIQTSPAIVTEPLGAERGAAGARGERDMRGSTLSCYRLIDCIGRGALSAVYRGVQEPLGREVAVKVLTPTEILLNDLTGRFKREARMLARLKHANVLPIYDYGAQDGLLYLVMPLIQTTMRDRFDGRQMHVSHIECTIGEIAAALHNAHEAGIVHGNLSPSNLRLHHDGRCLLSDFGLSTVRQNEQLSIRGKFIGSPEWMAPELILGKPVDRHVDLYALGLLAFRMVTGTAAFRADCRLGYIFAAVREPVPSAHSRNASLSSAVDRFFLTALAKDPAQRPKTAVEFLERFRAALRDDAE
jgi:serine/threonine protein kinase